MPTPSTFGEQYRNLVRDIVHEGTAETNERTGHVIHVAPSVSAVIQLDLGDGLLPVPHHRRVHPRTMAAEIGWFLSGQQSIEWLRKYTKIWDKFTEPGRHTVEAAYGFRYRRWFGRDQFKEAVAALRINPSDRRVNISAWDPMFDGLTSTRFVRNVPCPTNFTLSIHAGRLHSQLVLRSSDVFMGLPYDVGGHAILMALFANELGVRLGCLQVAIAHAHVYDVHATMVEQMLTQPEVFPLVRLPRDLDLTAATADPDALVSFMTDQARNADRHPYNPTPEIIP